MPDDARGGPVRDLHRRDAVDAAPRTGHEPFGHLALHHHEHPPHLRHVVEQVAHQRRRHVVRQVRDQRPAAMAGEHLRPVERPGIGVHHAYAERFDLLAQDRHEVADRSRRSRPRRPPRASAMVSEPSPAPISTTWSPSATASARRTMRRTVLGSATKFCPRLWRGRRSTRGSSNGDRSSTDRVTTGTCRRRAYCPEAPHATVEVQPPCGPDHPARHRSDRRLLAAVATSRATHIPCGLRELVRASEAPQYRPERRRGCRSTRSGRMASRLALTLARRCGRGAAPVVLTTGLVVVVRGEPGRRRRCGGTDAASFALRGLGLCASGCGGVVVAVVVGWASRPASSDRSPVGGRARLLARGWPGGRRSRRRRAHLEWRRGRR